MSAAGRHGPAPDVLVSHLEGEAVLLHMGTKRYFRLNRTGAHIWAMLEAGRDAGAIAQSLAETFEVSMTDAEESVAVLLAELRAAALICERAPAE